MGSDTAAVAVDIVAAVPDTGAAPAAVEPDTAAEEPAVDIVAAVPGIVAAPAPGTAAELGIGEAVPAAVEPDTAAEEPAVGIAEAVPGTARSAAGTGPAAAAGYTS